MAYAMVIIFPAVILSGYLFGLGPGVYAAVLCGIVISYSLIPKYNNFELGENGAVYLLFYTVVVTIDLVLIHIMQRANIRLRREREHSLELARRAELLFNELQHRVGNNLQMIGAVLGLQQVSTTDPVARMALANAGSKLELIGRIQRRLYRSNGEHLNLDSYLRGLVMDLVAAGDRSDVNCHFALDQGIDLPVDNAIALALIVAEAVANAIEHGFKGDRGGNIEVGLSQRQGMVEVRVRDDGVGLPEDFDQSSGNSLGIDILRTLASQLGGDVDIADASPGTVVTLRMRDAEPVHALEVLAA
jgi:two-component sensor histidine kinase